MTTRKSNSSKLSDFVGPGKKMLQSEVPTLRDCLQRGLSQQQEEERDKRQFTILEMMSKVASEVIAQWLKANHKFVPPVVIMEKSVTKTLVDSWGKVRDIAQGKITKKASVQEWKWKLDKLFDITVCKCEIKLCSDSNSDCGPDCATRAHVNCPCPMATKIPVLELEWLAYQRRKIGSVSGMQMGKNDKVETKKQQKAAQRKQESLDR